MPCKSETAPQRRHSGKISVDAVDRNETSGVERLRYTSYGLSILPHPSPLYLKEERKNLSSALPFALALPLFYAMLKCVIQFFHNYSLTHKTIPIALL